MGIEEMMVMQSALAIVKGQPLLELPKNLYIPPEALKVILEAFEGPLDLLLYLIKRQNVNIVDIPIAAITAQYMEYIDLMQQLNIELAAEYLLMAAMLAEIKSRMLLPRPAESEEEDDPRVELIKRLQEYERFKQAAQDLDRLPRVERDIFPIAAQISEIDHSLQTLPQPNRDELLMAFRNILKSMELNSKHQISHEVISVRERMVQILTKLTNSQRYIDFVELLTSAEGRLGVVVTFIAVLELLRQALIEMVQARPFDLIHLKAKV